MDRDISAKADRLYMNDSEFLRACIAVAGPLLLRQPKLVDLNRTELENLAAYIGNSLELRPAGFVWHVTGKKGEEA